MSVKIKAKDMKALDTDWDDINEVWDFLVDNDYFTEDELYLIRSMGGYSVDTFDRAVYSRFNIDTAQDLAIHDGYENPNLPDEVTLNIEELVDFPDDYEPFELKEGIDTVLAEDYPDARGAEAYDYNDDTEEVRVYNIVWDV